MLKKFSKGLCAVAVATSFMATTAQADIVHTVLIMDGGFFPAVTYVKPGDSIHFLNNSEELITLASADESWVSEALATDDDYTLPITANTPLSFVATFEEAAVSEDEGEVDSEYIALDTVVMEGAVSFDTAPLDEDAG